MDPLTDAFISLDREGFSHALNDRLRNNGFLHPRFNDGLLLKDEFEYYIAALRKRVSANDPYLMNALACEDEYYSYQYRGVEILSPSLKRQILSPGYIDEFGNHSLIAAVQTKDLNLIYLALELYPSLINVQGKFGDRALDHACILIEPEIVSMLMDAGANPNLKSAFNGRPIDWLLISGENHPDKIDDVRDIADMLNNYR